MAGDTITYRFLLGYGVLGVQMIVVVSARNAEDCLGGSVHFLSVELERRVLRRRGSCDSNDCKEQSFAFARGDLDLDLNVDVDVDELSLEEEKEEEDLSAILPLMVFAVVTVRPRVVVPLEEEDDDAPLDFFASAFSASRGERRRG